MDHRATHHAGRVSLWIRRDGGQASGQLARIWIDCDFDSFGNRHFRIVRRFAWKDGSAKSRIFCARGPDDVNVGGSVVSRVDDAQMGADYLSLHPCSMVS